MSYSIESIAEALGARRIGTQNATIDWLLTDSRSLSFPEETLFFALNTKRNNGVRYIPELYDRGVRNFVITDEDLKLIESGALKVGHDSLKSTGPQYLHQQMEKLNLLVVCKGMAASTAQPRSLYCSLSKKL